MGVKVSGWTPTRNQLLCRDLMHSWTPRTAKKHGQQFIRTLKCGRCDCIKTQILDKKGYIMSSRMTYPDGYLRPGGGRLTRADRANIRIVNAG